MEWVRLDPHGEALAAVRIAQPEAMAAAQLERSKDVAAQSEAIAQLAALRPTTYGVVNALRNCLRDPATYCRRALCLTFPDDGMSRTMANSLFFLASTREPEVAVPRRDVWLPLISTAVRHC